VWTYAQNQKHFLYNINNNRLIMTRTMEYYC